MSQNSPQKWFNLEEHFFKDVDQKLMADLRNELESANTAEAIMSVSGIDDKELAQAMAELDVSVDTLAAFRLAPLVAVAWADDRVEENERYVITKSAEKTGLTAEEPAMLLLKSWTERRPPAELMDAWCEYAKSLMTSLEETHRRTLRKEMLEKIQAVAEANGGFLGFGSISPSEQAVIDRVDQTLT